MKQIFALEDLHQTSTKFEVNASVENLENKGSGWVFDRFASMTTDLYKDKTKSNSSFVDLPGRFHQFSTFKTRMIIYVDFAVL